jgi:hypothetical protein
MSPENFNLHLKRFTTSLASTMAYGWRTTSVDLPQVKSLFEAIIDTLLPNFSDTLLIYMNSGSKGMRSPLVRCRSWTGIPSCDLYFDDCHPKSVEFRMRLYVSKISRNTFGSASCRMRRIG